MTEQLAYTSCFQVAQMIIRLPVQETQVPSLDREDPLEKGMAAHSSILSHRQRGLVGCIESDTTE